MHLTAPSFVHLPRLGVVFTTVVLGSLAGHGRAQEILAIKGARVMTITGAPLPDATVLCENGKIKEIGKDVEIPWNATVIEAAGKVVMPCWVIAHTSGGLDRENEQMPVVPFVTVHDAVDPVNEYFEQALRDGVGALHVIPGNNTVIGGQGAVVRPYGRTIEEMMVKSRGGMKISYYSPAGGRAAQATKVRRVFEDLTDYLKERDRKKKEHDEEKALPGGDPKKEYEEEIETQKKPLVELIEGKLTAFVYVPGAAEIDDAVELIRKYKLKAVLVLGSGCYKAVAKVKEAGLPIVLDPTMEVNEPIPDTDEEKLVCPARVYHDAGIDFALSHAASGGGRGFGIVMGGGGTNPGQYPWWQMAVAIRNGVPRDKVIQSMTIQAARVLGLDNRLGSIEPGKDANLQILTGEPLAATTWVDKVVLDGKLTYDRAKDKRLLRLLARPDGKKDESKGSEPARKEDR